MVSKQSIEEQLKSLGFSLTGWGRAEIKELPHILLPGEEIYELVNGTYEGGFALAVATDLRLLLVDKKPMNYLTVEDIRFDMISEIDYSHRLLGAQINISTGTRDINFRSYNQPRLRKMIGHVQHCMAESKRQQSQSQLGQNQHLEHINEQLRAYLEAQGEYQLQLQRIQQSQQSGQAVAATPQKPTPSHELSDYLFARSLIAQYEEQTGKKLQSGLAEKPVLDAEPVSTSTMLPTSKRELHEIWSAGVQEVFGKHHQRQHAQPATAQASTTVQQHNSFEINPVGIVFSRLSILIRNRKFTRPTITKLSSAETIAG